MFHLRTLTITGYSSSYFFLFCISFVSVCVCNWFGQFRNKNHNIYRIWQISLVFCSHYYLVNCVFMFSFDSWFGLFGFFFLFFLFVCFCFVGLWFIAIPRLRVSVLLLFEPEGAKEDGSSGKVHGHIYLSRHPCIPWLNHLHVMIHSLVDEQIGIRIQLACRRRAWIRDTPKCL